MTKILFPQPIDIKTDKIINKSAEVILILFTAQLTCRIKESPVIVIQ